MPPITKIRLRRPTVRSLLKESDAGCIILAAAVLDHILERLHEAHVASNLTGLHPPKAFFQQSLAGNYCPLSTLAGKINIAYGYGLISQDEFDALNTVRKLRNKAAHCAFEFSFRDRGVTALISTLATKERTKEAFFALEDLPRFSTIPAPKRDFILVADRLIRNLKRKLNETCGSVLTH